MAFSPVIYGSITLEGRTVRVSKATEGKLTREDQTVARWVVRAEPHVRIRLKNIFGSVAKGRIHEIWLSDTDEVARDLLWFMERYPLKVSASDRKALLAGRRRQVKREENVLRILQGDLDIPEVDMALPARPYQEQAAAAVLNNRSLLLVDELGLGKTVSAIRVMADTRALPAMCVVQTSLVLQWAEDELPKFLPGLRVHAVSSSKPYDIRDRCGGLDPHVVVITYNKLASWEEHFVGKFQFIVFDEVQELRTGHADEWKASKKNLAAARLAAATPYRLGLTATPIYNYGGELWNVVDIISPGSLGTQEEFLREWCVGTEKRKARVVDPKALGTHLRASGLMMRRTRDEVGRELPAVNRVVHEVSLDESSTWLEESKQSAAELARIVLDTSAKSWDQMQAAGQLDMLLRQDTGIRKAPQVAAFVRLLLEQETDKVLLFGWHREVYRIWGELLQDVKLAWYTGTESPAKKRQEVQRFVEGEAQVMVMSLRAGTGLNRLQDVCATAVFGELDWSWGVHEQCTGRLHRDGQKRPVFAYYPIANSGSDPIICDVLGVKTSQLVGLRDPNGEPVIARTVDPDHIKKLARAYLHQTAS